MRGTTKRGERERERGGAEAAIQWREMTTFVKKGGEATENVEMYRTMVMIRMGRTGSI